MPVSEAQARISTPEFVAWQEFYSLEPFGEQFADYRNAQMCALFATAHGDKQYKPLDFMWDPDPKPEPSVEQTMNALTHQARMFNKARNANKKT